MGILDMIHQGEFNIMYQQKQPNGNLLIRLYKRGEKVTHVAEIHGLYTPQEAVIWEREETTQ